jgi:oxygen-independent coproporphyrinogen-3 oxidase
VIRVPPELLERHGVPAPRYTSYPTAMHWGAPPSASTWLSALDNSLSRAGARAGLYVHIPFCAALCTFCGCNMRVARSHSLAGPYVDQVLKEYSLYRTALGRRGLTLGGLYLGGGSPTWLPVGTMDRLLEGLLTGTSVGANADFAIEADARNTSRELLGVLHRHGLRRIEIGVQDFDPRVQQIVNRVQGEEEIRRVVEDARTLGFTSVGFDLIYGLPLQTAESLHATFDAVLRLAPDRVNFFPYAHVPWIKPSQRQYTEADLPDANLRRELFQIGRERLGGAGYVEIGIDHYALPTEPVAKALQAGALFRSFMGFSASHVDALLGLGVSALGHAGSAYAQNEKNLQQYEARVTAGELPLQRGHALSEEDQLIRSLLWALLGGARAPISDAVRHSPWWPEARGALEQLAADGLIVLSTSDISVTESGRAFLPVIGLAFDRYLRRALAA